MAPFNMEISWSTKALQGAFRFLNRIWQIYQNSAKVNSRENTKDTEKLIVLFHKTVQKVGSDIQETKFNTAIAAMMEFLNEWERGGVGLSSEEAKNFLKILSPFAPFLAEKLWREVYKEKGSVCVSIWPEVNVQVLEDAQISIPVQVNGKVRGTVSVTRITKKEDAERLALNDGKIQKHIDNKLYKLIYVPGKILSFVLDK
jgi:leucyl-tRNA synthetase